MPVEKPEEIHAASAVKETTLADCTAPTAQVWGCAYHFNFRTIIQDYIWSGKFWKKEKQTFLTSNCVRHDSETLTFLLQVEEEINGTPVTSEAEISEISVKPKDVPPPSSLPLSEVDNSLQMEALKQAPSSQEPNGEVPQPLVYPGDPSMTFISQPPPLHVPPPQVGLLPAGRRSTLASVFLKCVLEYRCSKTGIQSAMLYGSCVFKFII